MTISAYQVDNLIKAYSKQTKGRIRLDEPLPGPAKAIMADSVTLSSQAGSDNVYQKISYTLIDLLKK